MKKAERVQHEPGEHTVSVVNTRGSVGDTALAASPQGRRLSMKTNRQDSVPAQLYSRML